MSQPLDQSPPPGVPGGAIGASFDRILSRVTLGLAILGGLGTLGIMAIINADVIGRGAFGAPVPATAEIVAATIVAVVFLQLPNATAAGRNVRADMFLSRLRHRSPRAGDALDALHHAIGTLMLGILLRYIGPEIIASIEGNETVGLYGIFTMPRWPFVTCVLIGCALSLAQFAWLTCIYTARAASGERS